MPFSESTNSIKPSQPEERPKPQAALLLSELSRGVLSGTGGAIGLPYSTAPRVALPWRRAGFHAGIQYFSLAPYAVGVRQTPDIDI